MRDLLGDIRGRALWHDRTGSYALAFAVLAGLNGATFALLFAVRDERRLGRRGVAPRISGP